MQQLHNEFPVYHWKNNKGYGTAAHRDAYCWVWFM
jgi:ribonuclease HII